ncbi:DNA polymerase kappa [Oryzias melastigma]|uniref:DNA polymerase kappa n=1 Tax=Oryzias melastigma TaxID=30732 RepID=A0A3B3BHA7_ORYME|nr:DNA polymerase kappa [Oryzias melastigma]
MDNEPTATKDEGFLSRMALNDNKAGMEGLDRDKINSIIMESSKGSKFYENELKKDQQVNQRIEKMMLQKARITQAQLKKAQAQVEKMTLALERSRDLSRVIVHVDMDAFYAAVEMRDCPELKTKPMAVGSMSMLSTSNYHARKYGVRAAMPGFIAKKLCSDLVIVPPNFDKYRAVSEEIREIFADYDPHFLPMSLDEAYLDFTEHLQQRQAWPESLRTHRYSSKSITTAEKENPTPKDIEAKKEEDLSPVLFEESPGSPPGLHGSKGANEGSELFGTCVEEAVREMRFRIEQKTTLTASAGIAPNMMLAKVCSDKNKPNGQYRLPPTREAVMDFMEDLPVRKVCGIGKVSEKMLNALGITKCSHLGQQMALLSLLFSETSCRNFMEVSLGLGSTRISRHEERKSMSIERTFKELSDAEEQFSLCRELCKDLAEDMKKEGLKGKTVSLKLKNVNFEVKTRAQTLPCAVAAEEEIFAVAKDLLKTEIDNEGPHPLKLRLMGVRMSAFVSSEDKAPMQKSILGFLQSGKPESSGSSERMGEPSHNPSQTSQQNATRKEEVFPHRRKTEETQNGGEPQQSFFQRAHAKRLQLLMSSVNTQDEGCGAEASGIPSKESAAALNKNGNLVPPVLENKEFPVEDRPSTSGYEPHSQTLICPVCSSKVETTDLNTFNRHIDVCLNVASTNPKKCEPESVQEYLQECRELNRRQSEADEEQPVSSGVCPWGGQHGGQIQKVSLTQSDSKPTTSQQCQGKRSDLVCPVCHLTQETDDLAVFNRHVDLCLNQEVLHELKGQAAFSQNPSAVKNSQNIASGNLPKQVSKGKNKRRGSPSSLPSKKLRSLGLYNTIDKFFR